MTYCLCLNFYFFADLERYVLRSQGEFLTDGGGFAPDNGKDPYGIWLLSVMQLTRLADEGLLELEPALAQRRFSLVILTWQSCPRASSTRCGPSTSESVRSTRS